MNRVKPAIKRLKGMNPAAIVLTSYISAIGVGACLLLLPFSTKSGQISLVDALFTATSAVCVTGLTVVDTGRFFAGFGQGVILVLIQLGGLGIMTVSVAIFHLLGKSISFRHRMILQEGFTHTPREDIYHLLKAVILFTAVAEASGSLLLFFHWSREYPPLQALYTAVFHSVSAFCNAGFCLFDGSFMAYRSSVWLNLIICVLIVLGGIGFPVVYDIYQKVRHRERRLKLSLQTKTVLVTSAVLTAGGMVMFGVVEHHIALKDSSMTEWLLTALFQSVTCRTAGFNTVDMSALSNATLGLMIFLMFVGASPGSCGGGVKTTTLAILAGFTWSRMRRRIRVNMFKKSIPSATVYRSISLLLISIFLISVFLFLLLIFHQSRLPHTATAGHFLSFLFEVVSAFGTVGLSMGATAELNTVGKLLILMMMLVGRVGVLTFSYIIVGSEPRNGIEYTEEHVMIG